MEHEVISSIFNLGLHVLPSYSVLNQWDNPTEETISLVRGKNLLSRLLNGEWNFNTFT